MGWRKDKLGRWRYSHRCDACRRSFSKVRIAPMLHDGVWLQIADEREHLCEPCARQRAKYHLGRDITMADLTPVEFNFGYRLWNLDILAPGNMTPEIEAKWDAAIDKAARDHSERQAAIAAADAAIAANGGRWCDDARAALERVSAAGK
jgi:hypothetical protein